MNHLWVFWVWDVSTSHNAGGSNSKTACIGNLGFHLHQLNWSICSVAEHSNLGGPGITQVTGVKALASWTSCVVGWRAPCIAGTRAFKDSVAMSGDKNS